jgi:gas vesicle protein
MAKDYDGSNLIWFLTGAAIGASIALLYAPQSGEETRQLIGEKARAGKDALADTSRDLVERGREFYERGRRMADEAAELMERGRRIVDRADESAAEAMQG